MEQLSNPAGHLSQRTEELSSHKHLYANGDSGCIYDNQTLETNQSCSGQMIK